MTVLFACSGTLKIWLDTPEDIHGSRKIYKRVLRYPSMSVRPDTEKPSIGGTLVEIKKGLGGTNQVLRV